jgi:hypothetical protein
MSQDLSSFKDEKNGIENDGIYQFNQKKRGWWKTTAPFFNPKPLKND